MVSHTAPGEIWWDGLMRVSQDFVEYIETKVTPRLGAEKTKQCVSWIPEYEKHTKSAFAICAPRTRSKLK